MIPFIYLLIFIAWIALIAGFIQKDFSISAIAAMFLMVLGVYTAIYGLEGISNFATQALAIIHIGIGFYVMIRGSYELYKKW